MREKKIIIAPLNWGLGHASRCIPIIDALVNNDFIPVIASDGAALALLQKEFPKIETLELASYDINYSKNLKVSLLKKAPKIFKAIKKEKEVVENYISKNKNVVGIISDNRFGVRSKEVPSVYITHQLNVASGVFTFLTSKIHQNMIKKFDECWIPDDKNSQFSGELSITQNLAIPVKHVGVLSRFSKQYTPIKNDILIILSGPEPNRSNLEEKLLGEFKDDTRKIVLIRGKLEKKQKKIQEGAMIIYNYMLSDQLEKEINKSSVIICRSGYSSIMDLAVLGKKVFFIPTTGQNEQEYLAEYLEKKKIAPFCPEKNFSAQKLVCLKNFKGFKAKESTFNQELLDLFKGK